MRALIVACILSASAMAIAGNGGSSLSGATNQEHRYEGSLAEHAGMASQLDGMGLGAEADNIRAGRPTGQFLIDGNGVKYVFIIMKMMIAVYFQGLA